MTQMAAHRDFETADLRPGTRLLSGQYQILQPLRKGGFAMTYVARDSLDRHVVIKECFPTGLCRRRDGVVNAASPAYEAQFKALKQQFICEARGMAKLQHPYVVAVHQVFEENNTAYMALDYVDGIDLITAQEEQPERLTPAFLENTLREALKAVQHIHSKGVLHRDIAPDNLRVDSQDRITLIDFGAAEAQEAGTAFASDSIPTVKDGYSPPEFYWMEEIHDFSSDLYSLGATFYHLITGEIPPSGAARREAVMAGQKDPYVPLIPGTWNCGYPILATVDMALNLDRADRPQSAGEWLKLLDELPRKQPVLPAPLLSDGELDIVLSRLVQDVNLNLVNETAKPAQAKPAAEPRQVRAKTPGQWVDIYGNPIADVTSWMTEQERKLQETPPPEAEPDAEPELARPRYVDPRSLAFQEDVVILPPLEIPPLIIPPPTPLSSVRGFLSRCLGRRRSTLPT